MKPKKYPTATIQCVHCGAQRNTVMEQYVIGQVLQPYPGGGNYGYCIKCQKQGMRVIEIPKPVIKMPVGWKEIPR